MVSKISDKSVDFIVHTILLVIGFIYIFPLIYVIAVSLTPYSEVLKNGGFVLIPKRITLQGYKEIFRNSGIPRAFMITVFITAVGTFINLLLTVTLAYPLSKKDLPGRKFWLLFVLFPMIFGASIIPTYLVVKATGLLNSVWAMIIPLAVTGYNTIILKTFFEGVPESLAESAMLDGAGEFQVLWHIVLPLSKPAVTTVGMYYAVNHWNEFFNAVYYITDVKLNPLQVVLRNIIDVSTMASTEINVPTLTIQMAAVVVVIFPVLIVYFLLQKHIEKGMPSGAVKG